MAGAAFSGPEDQAQVLGLAAFDAGFDDPDGQALAEIRIASLPSFGALTLDGAAVAANQVITRSQLDSGLLVYTPQADFDGEDAFLFFASDGISYSGQATATIDLTPVNDAPGMAALNDTTVTEGTAVRPVIVLADPDSDLYSYAVDWGDGSPAASYSSFSKTPSLPTHAYAAEGRYTVTVTVNDNAGQPNSVETGSYEVTVENAAPVPRRDNLAVSEDGTAAGDLFANNGYGADSDPGGDAFAVTAVNGVAANVGQEIAIGDGLRITVQSDGSIAMDAAGAYEGLADWQSATESFTYTVTDSDGGSASVTSYVRIDGQNDRPEPQDDLLEVQADSQASGNVIAGVPDAGGADTDPDDGNTLSVVSVEGQTVNAATGSLITLASGATVFMTADGTFTYDTNGAFAGDGSDSFGYVVSDGRGGTAGATVSVTVGGSNAAPVAEDDAATTAASALLSGNLFLDNGAGPDSDPDGDPISVTRVEGLAANVGQWVALASGARVRVQANGDYEFDPDGAFEALPGGGSRDVAFGYRIEDGQGGFDEAVATVTVTGENGAPAARRNDYSGNEDAAISGNVIADDTGNGRDSDPDDGDILQVARVNGSAAAVGSTIQLASGASLTVNADGTFSYDPTDGWNALRLGTARTDSFTYRIEDGGGLGATATVYLQIAGRNDAPEARDDAFGVTETGSVSGSVLVDNGSGADSDPDVIGGADTLAVVAVDSMRRGTPRRRRAPFPFRDRCQPICRRRRRTVRKTAGATASATASRIRAGPCSRRASTSFWPSWAPSMPGLRTRTA
ncbi:Ig-like domain-containing protein [Mangrovicoccus ximenensis]|uniref:Ig-like domain-containing protein n=1 Tax=Mangrovicoccus ximenensis TaxID=1911570 RepID=UPI000D351154|nr:Ig-like domain-containing protein [Mangrovicoccus ximenensis]